MNRRIRIATNRTEFARHVDSSPACIPEWEKLRAAYFAKKHSRCSQFGQFMRSMHPELFLERYENWWVTRPDFWSGGVNQDILANALTGSRSIA